MNKIKGDSIKKNIAIVNAMIIFILIILMIGCASRHMAYSGDKLTVGVMDTQNIINYSLIEFNINSNLFINRVQPSYKEFGIENLISILDQEGYLEELMSYDDNTKEIIENSINKAYETNTGIVWIHGDHEEIGELQLFIYSGVHHLHDEEMIIKIFDKHDYNGDTDGNLVDYIYVFDRHGNSYDDWHGRYYD